MSDLIVFLNKVFEIKIEQIIEKLKCCLLEKKYRAQITILDWIVQTSTILDEKAKRFWKYVIDNAENWRFHHLIVLNLIATYSIVSEIMNAAKKKRNVYRKTIHIIEQHWKKKNRDYVVNQSLKILRNMRKMIIKNWFVYNAMKALKKIIDHWLKNSNRDVRKKIISINDD